MAAYGAVNLRFAPFAAEETEKSKPEYGTPVSLGPLVTVDLSINNVSAEDYGDDKLQVKITEFSNAALPIEVTECPKPALAIILGASYDEEKKEIAYGVTDSPPYGGLSHIRKLKRPGKKETIYESVFYTKVQAAQGNEKSQSKSNSITIQHAIINCTAYPPLKSDVKWRYVAEHETMEAAEAWIDEKFGVTKNKG